jgi:hypothetical protein
MGASLNRNPALIEPEVAHQAIRLEGAEGIADFVPPEMQLVLKIL